MAGATLASADALFKRNYNSGNDVLIRQQNLSAPQWGKWKVSPLKPSPQGIYNPITMAGNENGGAINSEEVFQQPQSIVPLQPAIPQKLETWPFLISGSVIRLSESNTVAFIKGLDAQMQDNYARMFSDLNRQSWGTGTGQMTLTAAAGVATLSVVVDNPYLFRQGMLIDIWDTLGGTKQVNGAYVQSVDITTATVTVKTAGQPGTTPGPFTFSDNAIVCKHGKCDGVTSQQNAKEITGWQGICDVSTFGTIFEGVDTTQYPQFTGNVISAAGAPVSQDLLQRTKNRNYIVGGENPDKLVSNLGQARQFLNQELNKTRYEGGTVEAGNIKLMWGPLEWMTDWTYPLSEIGMMVENKIEKFQVADIKLNDLSGMTLTQVPNQDSVSGYYVWQGNIGVWKRNCFSRLTDLLEPTF